MRDVDPEPVHPPVQPEPEDLGEGLVHGRVPPVQVGLAGQEVVQVVLAGWLVPGPGAAAGGVQPVVGRPAAGARVGPHVEVPVRRVAAARRIHEPGMSRAGVVGYQVKQDPQAAPLRFGDKPDHVVERAEVRMDAEVIADVVAPVVVRRRHRRGQPDAVDPQPGQVIEPGDHAAEVAESVAVGVQPRPDVQLVEHRAVPPAALAGIAVHLPPDPVRDQTRPRLAMRSGRHRQ